MRTDRTAWFGWILVAVSLAIPGALDASEPYLVKDLDPLAMQCNNMTKVGDRVYFTLGIMNGTSSLVLWVSDGTPEGTHEVEGVGRVCGYPDVELAGTEERLLFLDDDYNLWAVDDTPEIIFTRTSGLPNEARDLVPAGSRVFFRSYKKLGVSDGTVAGTSLLSDWELQVPQGPIGLALGSRLCFTYNSKLWITDGTPEGTLLLLDRDYQARPELLCVFDGQLYFTADSPRADWVSDGTPEGTRPLIEGVHVHNSEEVMSAGQRVYFRDDSSKDRLYVCDPGLLLATHVADMEGLISFLAGVDERVFFQCPTADNAGVRLWVSDGTPAGTLPLKSFGSPVCCGVSMRSGTATVGGRLYFAAKDSERGAWELWTSDGTPEGTECLKAADEGSFLMHSAEWSDGYPGERSFGPLLGDRFLFCASHGGQFGLWALDQPAAGGLQRPGDANQDGGLDLSDAIWVLSHLFAGTPATRALPCEGGTASSPGPGDLALVDVNGDGTIDLSDPISVLSFLFLGSRPPALGRDCVPIPGCPDQCPQPGETMP